MVREMRFFFAPHGRSRAGTPDFTSSGQVNCPCGKVSALPKRLYAALAASRLRRVPVQPCQP